jgi:sporulation protein YlmC with PRC-barrel domain
MLIHARTLHGLPAIGIDGPVGKIQDLLFDDHTWCVRHVAVRCGMWPLERDILIAPGAVDVTDWTFRTVRVTLPAEEVRTAPDIDQDRPVSRQEELRLHEHQGSMLGLPNDGFSRAVLIPTATAGEELADSGGSVLRDSDPHLRSCRAVRGYAVRCANGHLVGRLADYVVDVTRWRIVYVVVERGMWPAPRRILLPPVVIRSVSWQHQEIDTRLAPTTRT